MSCTVNLIPSVVLYGNGLCHGDVITVGIKKEKTIK